MTTTESAAVLSSALSGAHASDRMTDARAKRPWLPALQGLRGIAALAIVVFHVAHIPQPRPARPEFLEPFLFALGNGVYLFFLLSAFGLAHSNSGRLGTFRQLAEYALRRIFRIAPLFYFMIVFYWLKFGLPEVGISGLFFNLAFVFNFIPKLHESLAWAGWTIGVEMPFYAILPLILAFDRKGILYFVGLALLISILSRAVFTTFDDLPAAYAMLAFTSNLFPFASGLLIYRYLGFRPPALLSGFSGNALCALLLLVMAWAIGPQVIQGRRFDVLLWTVPFFGCAGFR